MAAKSEAISAISSWTLCSKAISKMPNSHSSNGMWIGSTKRSSNFCQTKIHRSKRFRVSPGKLSSIFWILFTRFQLLFLYFLLRWIRNNFSVLFRVMYSSLNETLERKIDKKAQSIGQLKLWEKSHQIITQMLEIVKKLDMPRNFSLFLKVIEPHSRAGSAIFIRISEYQEEWKRQNLRNHC